MEKLWNFFSGDLYEPCMILCGILLATLQNRLIGCDAHLEMVALSDDRPMVVRHLKITQISIWRLTY